MVSSLSTISSALGAASHNVLTSCNPACSVRGDNQDFGEQVVGVDYHGRLRVRWERAELNYEYVPDRGIPYEYGGEDRMIYKADYNLRSLNIQPTSDPHVALSPEAWLVTSAGHNARCSARSATQSPTGSGTCKLPQIAMVRTGQLLE